MGKKVLLVTLFDEGNIGNRLQHYAMCSFLKERGALVTNLDNGYTRRLPLIKRLKYFAKKVLVNIGLDKYEKECRIYEASKKRKKAGKEFNRKNIDNVLKVSNDNVFKMNWDDYDLAIAGSDQVWHKWRDDKKELPFYYLQFVPSDKRFAYAASFGFEEIPANDYEQHFLGLCGMNSITCREQSGCDIVNKITGGCVKRVLDPTLLLDAKEWDKIANQSKLELSGSEYAFSFFLGDITKDYEKHINSLMKENHIARLIDFKDKCVKEKGPCEFLDLIKHSKYIFTDSFHATVFSLIFQKNIVVFRRNQVGFENMFGRIEDLLASVGKLDSIYGGTARIATDDFEILRNQSIEYLESVLLGK